MTHLEYLNERIRIELEILVDYIFHVRFVRFPLLSIYNILELMTYI